MKEERFTPVTESIKAAITRAAILEGGVKPASMIWGISDRSIRRIRNGQKFVSLSWMDRFCCVAPTELWVSDFEWKSNAELVAEGLWEPGGTREIQRPCKVCGREIEDANRRIYCSDDCMHWANHHRDA
jgi:hypothetical protein